MSSRFSTEIGAGFNIGTNMALTIGAALLKRRVFLSFQWKTKSRLMGVRLLARNKNFEMELYDESVRTAIKSANAPYIKTKIREKIKRSGIVICFVGRTTYLSHWVDWELETAIKMDKPIIAMGLPKGPDRLQLPGAISDQAWWGWDLDLLARRSPKHDRTN